MKLDLITFDFGDTLFNCKYLGDKAGLSVLLKHAIKNPYNANEEDLVLAGLKFNNDLEREKKQQLGNHEYTIYEICS